MNPPTSAASLRFGRFELQPYERRLLVSGEPALLGGRALDLLLALAERPGQLVGKHALMDLVWPDVVVEENNLATQVSALRKVLGNDVIATIPGRGYRFTAMLDTEPGGNVAGPATSNDLGSAAPSEGPRAPAAPSAPATNLPAELTRLLGRADDLATLGPLIDQHRLVTIIGAGGTGKSLLAQHLLDARRGKYPHGVCWVELTPVNDPAALPGAIAAALGAHSGSGEPLAALASAVAPLTMLVALDNAEHLLASVALLCDALCEAAPGLRFVVTSQAPLNLSAERVYRLATLAVPDGPLPSAKALEFGAVALFTERAQAADARFVLTDANAHQVIELCRALDGLALAIELAAARAPMLGVQRLALSMQDRLKLLTASQNRAAPARQQTLRAALEWSHSFLDEHELAVFRRLAVMAGSASLELIEQVVADLPGEGALDKWTVLDALGVLVDRSLVVVLSEDLNEANAGTPTRYRLLDSPKVFALERLVGAGEREMLQKRHALAMAARFDAEWDEYFSGRIGHDHWMHKLSPDLDNAREALAWASGQGDAESGLAIGATLLRALPKSQHAVRKAVGECCERLIGSASSKRLQQRAWAALAMHAGNSQRQRNLHAAQCAVSLARGLGAGGCDPFTLYFALGRLAYAAASVKDVDGSTAALVEMRSLEDPAWAAQRLACGAKAEGDAAAFHGRAAEALLHTRRAASLGRARGAFATDSIDLNLIDYELSAGNAATAARIGSDLVAALERTRDEYSLTFARLNLTAALLALGELEPARVVAKAGWPQAARFDLQGSWADHLALLAALEGRPQAAARMMGYSDATYAALDDRRQANEAAAAERAQTIARSTLDADEYAYLHAEGADLRDADIAALIFGTE